VFNAIDDLFGFSGDVGEPDPGQHGASDMVALDPGLATLAVFNAGDLFVFATGTTACAPKKPPFIPNQSGTGTLGHTYPRRELCEKGVKVILLAWTGSRFVTCRRQRAIPELRHEHRICCLCHVCQYIHASIVNKSETICRTPAGISALRIRL
jgi:hypothetical protein